MWVDGVKVDAPVDVDLSLLERLDALEDIISGRPEQTRLGHPRCWSSCRFRLLPGAGTTLTTLSIWLSSRGGGRA